MKQYPRDGKTLAFPSLPQYLRRFENQSNSMTTPFRGRRSKPPALHRITRATVPPRQNPHNRHEPNPARLLLRRLFWQSLAKRPDLRMHSLHLLWYAGKPVGKTGAGQICHYALVAKTSEIPPPCLVRPKHHSPSRC